MTNKEAIRILSNMVHDDKAVYGYKSKPRNEALDLAIKALEFAESQRICCENCDNRNRKSKEVCASPYGVCAFFEDKTQEGGAE